MKGCRNRIVIRGIKAHRALLRSIECQVEKWIERERTLLFLPRQAEYEVQVDKDEECPFFLCTVRVRLGFREWKSREGGKTIQESVSQALKHLQRSESLSYSPRASGQAMGGHLTAS